jgi:transposase-like protein
MKKTFTPQQKTTIVLDSLGGKYTASGISSNHEVHATQIAAWKKQAKEILVEGFGDKRKTITDDRQKQIDMLHQIIGKRDVELEWLKKKLQHIDA